MTTQVEAILPEAYAVIGPQGRMQPKSNAFEQRLISFQDIPSASNIMMSLQV